MTKWNRIKYCDQCGSDDLEIIDYKNWNGEEVWGCSNWFYDKDFVKDVQRKILRCKKCDRELIHKVKICNRNMFNEKFHYSKEDLGL